MKTNFKNKLRIFAASALALAVLACTACSSEKPAKPDDLTSDDLYLKEQITENLSPEITEGKFAVEFIKSAKDKDDVIVNIFLDNDDTRSRKGQDAFFIKAFDIVKETDSDDKVEAMHVNYVDGESVLSIYDLEDFENATDENLTEKVSILELNVEK